MIDIIASDLPSFLRRRAYFYIGKRYFYGFATHYEENSSTVDEIRMGADYIILHTIVMGVSDLRVGYNDKVIVFLSGDEMLQHRALEKL